MNYYPGEGLAIGTAILGSMVGQALPEGSAYSLCKIYGKILTPEGIPVGSTGQSLSSTDGGSVVLVPSWEGVKVTAALAASAVNGGSVISVGKVSTTTNEHGYFELHVIRGLTVNVASPSSGMSIQVATAGLTSVDISTLF